MIRRFVIATVSALMMTGAAYAFEKTAESGSMPPVASKPLDLSSSKKALEAEESGAVVRIPGLGALGVLPKLDFGLELLYGENQPDVAPREEEEPDSDGLRIRGTLKHRF